jgi:hypothetical protein
MHPSTREAKEPPPGTGSTLENSGMVALVRRGAPTQCELRTSEAPKHGCVPLSRHGHRRVHVNRDTLALYHNPCFDGPSYDSTSHMSHMSHLHHYMMPNHTLSVLMDGYKQQMLLKRNT